MVHKKWTELLKLWLEKYEAYDVPYHVATTWETSFIFFCIVHKDFYELIKAQFQSIAIVPEMMLGLHVYRHFSLMQL